MENSTSQTKIANCVSNSLSRNIFTAWFTVYLLLLPVFLLILYIGFNKWKKPQSSASGGLSHSDVFTLNMVAMEMNSIVWSYVVGYGFYSLNEDLMTVGKDTLLTTVTGQVLFHTLTCVERYLAVVHPVTYLRLRREGGVTVRNISIALVWVFSVVYILLSRFVKYGSFQAVAALFLAIAPFPLVTYCSIYVLCVLTRPKPGERGGPRKQIDQSKRSTVYTMVAILAALLMRLITNVGFSSVSFIPFYKGELCIIAASCVWSILPSSLVLPLLFLQRAGKLKGCK